MPNPFFQFKQFTVHHDRCAMKVTTDACLFGAWTADEIKQLPNKAKRILDIGCGSALLSLLSAQKNEAQIDAVEIDKDAASQATQNVNASPWQNRIDVVHENVLNWKTNHLYDCILSNPPFYENDLKSDNKAKNLAHHDEGLQLPMLFIFIKKHLSPQGICFLLLPAKREQEAEHLLKISGLHLHKKIWVKQTANHKPFRVLLRAGNAAAPIVTDEIVIKIDGHYSSAFIHLLRDYYLYL